MRNIIKNCPNDKFIEIFNSSNSYHDIIKKFNLNCCGSQYDAINRKIKELNLDPSIMDSKRWKINALKAKSKSLKEILIKNSSYTAMDRLKKRLIKEKLLTYKCYSCNLLPIWNNRPLSLQIDHINGIRNDHRIDNLRFLCPNCHSQSDTYAGKNKRKHTV